MHGADQKQEAMFSYVSPEKRVPSEHPLRLIRETAETVLKEMSLAALKVSPCGGT
jgi:hypothetical protein